MTSIPIPSSEPFIMFINIRVLRLRSTDRKSSLNDFIFFRFLEFYVDFNGSVLMKT